MADGFDAAAGSRRAFLKVTALAGGGMALGFSWAAEAQAPASAPGTQAPPKRPIQVDAWVKINPDNTVTLTAPVADFGQGVYTVHPQMLAEELNVPWNAVKVEQAIGSMAYGNPLLGGGTQGVGNSVSVMGYFDPLRTVGATAREMLRQAAANEWKVPLAEIIAKDGKLSHAGAKKNGTYAQFAAAAAKLPVPENVPLKDRTDWTILGTSPVRLDVPAKVDGTAKYGLDVRVPGMKAAAIAMCPHHGGALKAVDEAPALKVKGVTNVVKMQNAVAVVADHYWQAKSGLEALKPEWDAGANASVSTESLFAEMDAAVKAPTGGVEIAKGGDLAAVKAAKTVESLYEAPYLAHACMEPMNATAHVRDGECEIWAPTQSQTRAQQWVGQLLGIPPEKVIVHTTFLGGGFGRRSVPDVVVQAAEISRAVKAPVQLVWSREDDVKHDFYRPGAKAKLRAMFDQNDKPIGFEAVVASGSIMKSSYRAPNVPGRIDPVITGYFHDMFYDIPNYSTRGFEIKPSVPLGMWRSVAASQNVFFLESFIDEMAVAAKMDPLAFRRAYLKDPRWVAVLNKAADMARYDEKRGPRRAVGLAAGRLFGSYVGTAVDAEVSEDKVLTIHGVYAAADVGIALHPKNVKYQVEGAIQDGLSAAFYQKITFENGATNEGNFNDVPFATMAQVPPIAVEIIDSGAKIGGIGEAGLPGVAPALANAIARATGERIRVLPFIDQGFTLA
jgi:CO/xanthine dehydrogenase Mo-binding subunit